MPSKRRRHTSSETGGYHSEVLKRGAQSVGAGPVLRPGHPARLRLAVPRSERHLQQWSPEDPEGPWLLMFVIGDEIRFGGSSGIKGTVGSITDLRGTWITDRRAAEARRRRPGRLRGLAERQEDREHDRHHGASLDVTDHPLVERDLLHGLARGRPAGRGRLTILHDNHRIASTYALAEPANWS